MGYVIEPPAFYMCAHRYNVDLRHTLRNADVCRGIVMRLLAMAGFHRNACDDLTTSNTSGGVIHKIT